MINYRYINVIFYLCYVQAKPSVEAFYSHITVDTSVPSTTTCCENRTHHIPVQHMLTKDVRTQDLSTDDSSDIDEDDFDERFQVPEIEDVDHHFLSLNAEQIIRNSIIPHKIQDEIISHPLLQEFLSSVWLKISKLWEQCIQPNKKTTSSAQTTFYS